MPSDSWTGLTSAEVAERVKRGESNDYKARVGRSYWEIVRDNLLNLFNIILFTLLVIVALFRDYTTVAFAGFSVVTNSFLGMIQEISAKRKLDKLAALAAQDVLVWRDGKLVKVPIAQIVKDDVIPIEPGDRLVVDGLVLESDALEMDESHLTGESDAVLKDVDHKLYSGSYCVAGSGLMVATAVGRDSTINRLSTAAKAYKNVQTPTQQKITALVEISVLAMAIFGPMLFTAGVVNSLEFVEIIRNTIVFVTSLVPQGLVLVAILSLTLGAIRISRHQTLIQRVNAVESMANVSVLCFDKTGTLTRNELAVTEILPLNGDTPAQIEGKLQTYLSNVSHMNRTAAAVAAYVNQPGKEPNTPNGLAKVGEVPFNSARKWGAVTFDNHETLLLGAPERLLPDSHAQQAEALAVAGLRVIAFVRTPKPPEDGHIGTATEPIALIVMSDQVRTDIHETLRAFQDQNVTLKVISGDNLETVKAIATQSGLKIRRAYTGDQLEAMSDAELEAAVADGDLFARIEPDTKRKLVGTLKHLGQYVAMVGDGVNDVPALKEAHLAIAMNDGAQIAKDVADIVLLNNAMSTLPLAFKEGKSITQTIYGTTKLFLAKNFYNILLFIFVGFMMLPFPISPTQISWITFGTVNIPATLIAFEILRPAKMERFRRDVFDYVVTAGLVGAVVMALLYAVAYFSGQSDLNLARSAVTVFIALYGTLIFWNVHGVDLLQPRTLFQHGRVTLLGIVLAAFTMAGPYLYPDPDLFHFVSPTPQLWVLIVALFLIATLVVGIGMRHRRLVNQLWLLFAP